MVPVLKSLRVGQRISEFVGEEFVSNNQAVDDGMVTIKMIDDTKVYTLAYIVPSEITLEDMILI